MCTTLDKHGPTERRPAAKPLPLWPLPEGSHAGMPRYSASLELCPVSLIFIPRGSVLSTFQMKKTQGQERENPLPSPGECGTLEPTRKMLSLTQLWPGRLLWACFSSSAQKHCVHTCHTKRPQSTLVVPSSSRPPHQGGPRSPLKHCQPGHAPSCQGSSCLLQTLKIGRVPFSCVLISP